MKFGRIGAVVVALAGLLVAVALWGTDGEHVVEGRTATEEVQRREPPPAAPEPLARRHAPEEDVPAPVPAVPEPVASPAFEEVYEQLVELHLNSASRSGPFARAEFKIDLARLLEAMRLVEDYGRRTVRKLGGLPIESNAPRVKAELLVCDTCTHMAFQELERNGDEEALELLAAELLAQLPYSPRHASLAMNIFLRGTILGPSHEELLLALARDAHGVLVYMAIPIRRLLLHLWSTRGIGVEVRLPFFLELAEGEGPAAEAAWIQLFRSPRWRDLAVQRILGLEGELEINSLAALAARHLDEEDGAALLATLAERGHSVAEGGAYFFAAEKGVAELVASYERTLADPDMAEHRGGIVNALLLAREDDHSAFALRAFEQDPSPLVRALAVQSLAARGGEDFERLFEAALSDRAMLDADNASILLSALKNYAGGEAAKEEVLRSALMQLRERGALIESERARLEEMLSDL